MIRSLTIRDLGVIEDATIEPSPGLTALTGETGAGKTMVVSSLGLLLGERADPALVRRGADRAVVETILDSDDLAEAVEGLGGQVEDGEVICSRHVLASRRSRSAVGGAQVTAGQLASVTGRVVTIHGQSEQIRLVDPAHQLDVLDRAGGADLAEALEGHRRLWQEFATASTSLRRATEGRQDRDLEIEVLRRRLAEVDAVHPAAGEDDELLARSRRLQGAQEVRSTLQRADALLNGMDSAEGPEPGALSLLQQAAEALEEAGRHDPEAAGLAERARSLGLDLADVAAAAAGRAAAAEADPRQLDEVLGRLASLQRLLRSRASTLDDLLAATEVDRRRLAELTGSDDDVEALVSRVEQLQEALAESAQVLGGLRRRTAARLERDLRPELAALAMSSAKVEFRLEPAPMGPRGTDAVTIMLAANSGARPAPLAKAASGGELSRVRLALEVVLADAQEAQTFVFDEVDAGVGGRVGVEIGRRLARLATRHQVLVVTHLAQVAAFAHTHLVVTKADDGTVTRSGVVRVEEAARQRELARMMSGMSSSQAALDHAAELLGLAASPGRPDGPASSGVLRTP